MQNPTQPDKTGQPLQNRPPARLSFPAAPTPPLAPGKPYKL